MKGRNRTKLLSLSATWTCCESLRSVRERPALPTGHSIPTEMRGQSFRFCWDLRSLFAAHWDSIKPGERSRASLPLS